jgi:hypothetical protein
MTDKNVVFTPAINSHWKNLFAKKSMVLGTHNLNPNEELILYIKAIKPNQIVKGKSGREDEVTFLEFEDVVPMCLNIGNSRIIASLYGDMTEDWIGKPIQIHAATVKAVGGGKTQGLCVRAFIPDVDTDVTKYEDAINAATTVDELQSAYLSAPKNLQSKLNKLTSAKKKELS